MQMTDPVQIKIDLASGTFEVAAPASDIGTIFDKIESFLPKMSALFGGRNGGGVPGGLAEQQQTGGSRSAEADVDAQKPASKRKSGSKAKETYKQIDFDMDDAKRAEFRNFFTDKSPTGQNDQTLVIMYGLSTMAGLPTVGWNEIFSGFRLLNTKVPAKISSVLGNMVGGGLVVNAGTGRYKLTHVGEDRVKLDLPSKKPAK